MMRKLLRQKLRQHRHNLLQLLQQRRQQMLRRQLQLQDLQHLHQLRQH